VKPIPNITDEAAMLLRGKQSAIASARKDAAETLRDACTHVQTAAWDELPKHAKEARDAADRLLTLAAMWDEVGA
jgi:hypothetical protein